MQALPPPTHRLSWFPIHPSWIVSIIFSLFAVLPHQTPLYIYKALRTRLGAVAFAALSMYVFWNLPVLGMAMLIFLISLQINTYVEKFSSTISKERVSNTKKWFQEEVLMEEPTIIQDRTDSPGIITDEVTDDSQKWFGENILGESPLAIQERPVGSFYYQETSQSEQDSISHK